MRVTSKGQVTIPIEMRRKYGIKPDMEVEFVEGRRGPEIVVLEGDANERMARLMQWMQDTEHERSEHAREMIRRMRGGWQSDMTTDDVMALTRGWGEDDFSR